MHCTIPNLKQACNVHVCIFICVPSKLKGTASIDRYAREPREYHMFTTQDEPNKEVHGYSAR